MELRSQPRLETDKPVHVTVLSESDTSFLGRITNTSRSGIGLLVDRPVPLGSAVKVEWGHTLLLGEVRHCRLEGDSFAIGLDLEHALYHTEELDQLAKRLLEEDQLIGNRREKPVEK